MSDTKMVDELAQFIRVCNGNNSMGAGELAERIVEKFGVQLTGWRIINSPPTEEDGYVLVWAENMPVSVGCLEEDKGYYLFNECEDWGQCFEGDVSWLKEHWTHWMPLPDPNSKQHSGTIEEQCREALEHELNSIQTTISTYPTPAEALSVLIEWHIDVATDQRTNGGMVLVSINRLETFDKLMFEMMEGHADSISDNYKGCDTDPCAWCVNAAEVLAAREGR